MLGEELASKIRGHRGFDGKFACCEHEGMQSNNRCELIKKIVNGDKVAAWARGQPPYFKNVRPWDGMTNFTNAAQVEKTLYMINEQMKSGKVVLMESTIERFVNKYKQFIDIGVTEKAGQANGVKLLENLSDVSGSTAIIWEGLVAAICDHYPEVRVEALNEIGNKCKVQHADTKEMTTLIKTELIPFLSKVIRQSTATTTLVVKNLMRGVIHGAGPMTGGIDSAINDLSYQ
jgi:hypothetical protein